MPVEDAIKSRRGIAAGAGVFAALEPILRRAVQAVRPASCKHGAVRAAIRALARLATPGIAIDTAGTGVSTAEGKLRVRAARRLDLVSETGARCCSRTGSADRALTVFRRDAYAAADHVAFVAALAILAPSRTTVVIGVAGHRAHPAHVLLAVVELPFRADTGDDRTIGPIDRRTGIGRIVRTADTAAYDAAFAAQSLDATDVAAIGIRRTGRFALDAGVGGVVVEPVRAQAANDGSVWTLEGRTAVKCVNGAANRAARDSAGAVVTHWMFVWPSKAEAGTALEMRFANLFRFAAMRFGFGIDTAGREGAGESGETAGHSAQDRSARNAGGEIPSPRVKVSTVHEVSFCANARRWFSDRLC
jgi:hypothetical protein